MLSCFLFYTRFHLSRILVTKIARNMFDLYQIRAEVDNVPFKIRGSKFIVSVRRMIRVIKYNKLCGICTKCIWKSSLSYISLIFAHFICYFSRLLTKWRTNSFLVFIRWDRLIRKSSERMGKRTAFYYAPLSLSSSDILISTYLKLTNIYILYITYCIYIYGHIFFVFSLYEDFVFKDNFFSNYWKRIVLFNLFFVKRSCEFCPYQK